ncbi:hypothetical protein C2S52_000987 [Perilla frutescens var. hirtella]|nr:hypothetical protein C2S52_000987 [Perilla frutescens var. hirtella]
MAPVFGTIDMLKPGRSTFGLEAERIHVTIPGSNNEKYKHGLIDGEVRVSTLFNVTKILTNQNEEDIAEFNSSTEKVRSATISTLTTSSSRTLNDEIKEGDFELKTISEILSDGKGRNIDGIPAGFEKLANRKALFNISVQPGQTRNYTGSFSVARICCDKEVIEKVCGKGVFIEDEESVFKTGGEYVEEMVDSTEDPISSLRSVDGNRHDVAMQKTIQQLIDEKQDKFIDNLPTEIDELVGVKGFFKRIVLAEKIKEPFNVVKESVAR